MTNPVLSTSPPNFKDEKVWKLSKNFYILFDIRKADIIWEAKLINSHEFVFLGFSREYETINRLGVGRSLEFFNKEPILEYWGLRGDDWNSFALRSGNDWKIFSYLKQGVAVQVIHPLLGNNTYLLERRKVAGVQFSVLDNTTKKEILSVEIKPELAP